MPTAISGKDAVPQAPCQAHYTPHLPLLSRQPRRGAGSRGPHRPTPEIAQVDLVPGEPQTEATSPGHAEPRTETTCHALATLRDVSSARAVRSGGQPASADRRVGRPTSRRSGPLPEACLLGPHPTTEAEKHVSSGCCPLPGNMSGNHSSSLTTAARDTVPSCLVAPTPNPVTEDMSEYSAKPLLLGSISDNKSKSDRCSLCNQVLNHQHAPCVLGLKTQKLSRASEAGAQDDHSLG